MPVLSNSRHEQFSQALVKGLSAAKAYTAAGYAAKGARQNAKCGSGQTGPQPGAAACLHLLTFFPRI